MRSKFKSLASIITTNLIIVVMIFAGFEVAGQLLFFIKKGHLLINEEKAVMGYKIFKEHPYLVGIPLENIRYTDKESLVQITTDENGFRITSHNSGPQTIGSSKKTIIICLGGSTTFGTLVSDEETWPFILQKKLGENYRVYNLGVPGYSTVEGIIQMALIVPELKPDIILIYQGWNDIRHYHYPIKNPDYRQHGFAQKFHLNLLNESFMDKLLRRSAVARSARRLSSYLVKKQPAAKNPQQQSTGNDPYIDALYLRNLITMKVLADNLSAKTIFIPQVLNLEAYAGNDQFQYWTPGIANSTMPELIKGFNGLMGKIPLDENTIVLNEITARPEWNQSYFVDMGHFNKKGSDLFTEILIPHIKKLTPPQ